MSWHTLNISDSPDLEFDDALKIARAISKNTSLSSVEFFNHFNVDQRTQLLEEMKGNISILFLYMNTKESGRFNDGPITPLGRDIRDFNERNRNIAENMITGRFRRLTEDDKALILSSRENALYAYQLVINAKQNEGKNLFDSTNEAIELLSRDKFGEKLMNMALDDSISKKVASQLEGKSEYDTGVFTKLIKENVLSGEAKTDVAASQSKVKPSIEDIIKEQIEKDSNTDSFAAKEAAKEAAEKAGEGKGGGGRAIG